MTISPLLTFNLKVGFTFSVLSPKACPYVMTQFVTSPIVADIIHRICQAKGSGTCIIKASAAKLFMKENMRIR